MSKYVFEPYNAIFPVLYEAEKKRLRNLLTGNYKIEHVGSTAVPELGGKGIIDIYITVPKEKLLNTSQKLLDMGYQYGKTASKKPPYIFHKIILPDPLENKRLYHVHLSYPEYEDYVNAIAFRDYLRTHPKDMQKYSEIKQKAALEANENRNIYIRVKSPFMQEILKKALQKDK